MIKNQCFIFLTTNGNSYERFQKIKSCNYPGIDFYYMIDISSYNGEIPEGENVITFNGDDVWNKWNGTIFYNKYGEYKSYCSNVHFIPIEFYLKNFGRKKEYDYYWYCEDDIFMPNGDYYEFFKQADKVKCDFLHMTPIFDGEDDNFTSRNVRLKTKGNTNLIYKLIPKPLWTKYNYWCWMQMFRISPVACRLIKNNFKSIHRAHGELCMPSIIKKNGLSCHCISESDEINYNFVIQCLPLNPKILDEELANTFYHPMKID